MRMRSSMVTVTPMRPSNSMVVVTSCRCGTLPIVTGPSASSAPARMGSVAFLAPEMRTSPSSGSPPVICSLSTPPLRRCLPRVPLLRRVRLDRERMDLAADALAERAVDQLMPRQRTQPLEGGSHQSSAEVRVVLGEHLDARLRQGLAYQFFDLFRLHERHLKASRTVAALSSTAAAVAGARNTACRWAAALSWPLRDRSMHDIETPPIDESALLHSARRTIQIESDALGALRARLDGAFAAACRICLRCSGRIVATGMGKSGHVARKIATTLASTGT